MANKRNETHSRTHVYAQYLLVIGIYVIISVCIHIRGQNASAYVYASLVPALTASFQC